MKRRKRGSTKPRNNVAVTKPLPIRLPALPVDVWHIVFENAPKATLLACSCVSRAWREVAVPYLFASIEVKRSAGDWADIKEELLDRHPHLMRHIRRLELGRNTNHSVRASDTYPVISRDELVTLCARLPCLKELRLCSLWISSRRQFLDVPITRRLNKLVLVHCAEEGRHALPVDPRLLLDFASTVPANIVTIELFAMQRQTVSPVPTPPFRLLSPHSFQFGSRSGERYRHEWDSMPWLCDALRDAFAPRCVASLCVGFWIPRHNSNLASLHTLGRFLHHTCSQSIRHLSFPVIINSAVASGSNDSDKAMFWRTLHLHEFTGMYTFDMSLAVVDSGTHPDSDDAPRVPLSAVCVAIFALLPPTLRRITITLWEVKEASQVKDKRMLGLSALDDALDARAPVLEQVRLVFRGEWYLLEFAEAATKAMAKCRKRGILEVGDWLHMG